MTHNFIVAEMMLAKENGNFTEDEVVRLLESFTEWCAGRGIETAGSWGLAEHEDHDDGGVPGFDVRA